MTTKKVGFEPVFDKNSKLLILGSFPSVKSREIEFYYGHKQNRFWKMLCGYFSEPIPETVALKKEFLRHRGIALWDMVTACEIEGSADTSVKNAETADLSKILAEAPICKILLNGTLSYNLFIEKYENISIPYQKMPSTSPANPRYDEKIWWNSLDEVFRTT